MKIHNSPYFSLGLSIFSAIFYILYMKLFLGNNAAMLFTTVLILYLFVMFKFHFIDITILFLIVAAAWKIYSSGMEQFENKQDRKKSKKKSRKEKMDNSSDKDTETHSDDEDSEEYEVSSEAGMGDEEGAPVKPPKKSYVDMGSTWMKAYNKLSPDQLTGMKHDTKELMETQKALVETLQTMGPTVQQGMDLVNTFQKYFGVGVGDSVAPVPQQ
jgi:hypothetical protein